MQRTSTPSASSISSTRPYRTERRRRGLTLQEWQVYLDTGEPVLVRERRLPFGAWRVVCAQPRQERDVSGAVRELHTRSHLRLVHSEHGHSAPVNVPPAKADQPRAAQPAGSARARARASSPPWAS